MGYGFLEKVYQRAMQSELLSRGLKAELETKIKVVYKGVMWLLRALHIIGGAG